MNLQNLFEKLFADRDDKDSPFRYFRQKNMDDIKGTIMDWAIEEDVYVQNLIKEKSVLEAKCYAYEEIIANSNFAPLIKTQKAGFCAGEVKT